MFTTPFTHSFFEKNDDTAVLQTPLQWMHFPEGRSKPQLEICSKIVSFL